MFQRISSRVHHFISYFILCILNLKDTEAGSGIAVRVASLVVNFQEIFHRIHRRQQCRADNAGMSKHRFRHYCLLYITTTNFNKKLCCATAEEPSDALYVSLNMAVF